MTTATTQTAATALEMFTTAREFNEFLDVGSTPELEQTKRVLKDKIAALPGNVRTALKDMLQQRLSLVRQELAVR